MNTKTMRLPPRRLLMASASTNKRKERDDGDGLDRPKPSATTPTKPLNPDKLKTGLESPSSSKGFEPLPSNQLLAGYLAHEFLTRGTLFGQPWDPSGAESPTSNTSHSDSAASEKMKGKPSEKPEAELPSRIAEQPSDKNENYVELAYLLKADGVHLPGIVNPTQLSL